MSFHRAKISWKKTTPDFNYDTYDRTHQVRFESGQSVRASSAPEFKGNAELVNPEELFVAALSNCHMLTFLAIASKSRLTVEEYVDEAVGELAKGANGKMCMTKVTLKPQVRFADSVSPEKLKELHSKAHHNCFIANSVSCEVVVE